MKNINIEAYINRINYKGNLIPNLDALKNLQKNHLLNVPFENLDIHSESPIDLNIDTFYYKIVEKKRGGFCYELNGLFNTLLQKLGYNAYIISARVYDNKKNDFGEEYDHLAIIVEINQTEYLVDVGFGEFTFYPLKLETGHIQSDPRGDFVIEGHENGYFKVSKIEGETISDEYIFTKKKRILKEFSKMCNYHQTSSNSHFTQKKIISKPTETGRVTITGNTLKITERNQIVEEHQFNNEDFGKYLWNYFNIDQLKASH